MHVWMFLDERDIPQTSVDRVRMLHQMLVDRANGEFPNEPFFSRLREAVLADCGTDPNLPSYVRFCETLGQFFGYFSRLGGDRRQRLDFMARAFARLVEAIETRNAPDAEEPSLSLRGFSLENSCFEVHWKSRLVGTYSPGELGQPLRLAPEMAADADFLRAWRRAFPASDMGSVVHARGELRPFG